ncbi:MAG: helix-turn-helix domain-containing protein [Lachnospiraceae bacterium]|nr:helix-turn-helix domain-containing protein [Lachnospiraceae bacterium]
MKIIIAEDNEIKDIVKNKNGVSIYDFPETLDKDEIIPIISSKNFKVASYFSHMGALHESLRSNDRELIASNIAKLLECPVDFVSRAGKVLVSVNIDENKKNRFAKNQYVPGINKIGDYHLSTIFFNPKHTSRLVALEDADAEMMGNYLFPIHADSSSPVVLGYVVLENMSRKVIDYLMPVMNYIQNALSLTFWSYERTEFRNASKYTAFIKQLLNGDLNDNVQIEHLVNEYLPLKSYPLLLIVVQIRDVDNEFRQNDNVISEVFPLGTYFSYNAASAVLIPYEEGSQFKKQLEQLQASLEKNDCTAGISEPIPKIDANFKNYFERAHAAAIAASALNSNGRRYLYYKEAALCHLAINLTEVPHLSGIRQSLVDVNLIRMIEQDARKGSDYFRTLQAYWHFNHDTVKICDYLHLSKSTLFYKLNKIKEFLGQDINDYENVLQLSMGIAILESMGLITRDVYPE